MANALYTKFKYNALKGNIGDMTSITIKAVCVDSQEYTPNLSTDASLADIPSGGRIATATLANKTLTNNVFDADDTTFTGVTGDQFEYVAIYKDSGVEATSYLIALIDTATGLALTPSGGDVIAQWNASGIFAL